MILVDLFMNLLTLTVIVALGFVIAAIIRPMPPFQTRVRALVIGLPGIVGLLILGAVVGAVLKSTDLAEILLPDPRIYIAKAAIFLPVVAIAGIARPFRPLPSRKAWGLIGLPVALLVMVYSGSYLAEAEKAREAARLEQLRSTDPDAYKAELARIEVEKELAAKLAAEKREREAKAEAERRTKKAAEEAAEAQRELCSNDVMAFTMAQEFVKKRLKAPSTADFPWIHDGAVRKSECGVFSVTSYVDAQNAFGAMLRTQYRATVKHVGNDNWQLVDIAFSE